MNYKTIYVQIITRGKSRKLTGYKEKHHIIPNCVGGIHEPENLVELTAREHFICHKLLTEMYPKETKLHYAVMMMATMKNAFGRNYIIGSREYQRLKENIVISKETRKKMSESAFGRKHTKETIEKMKKPKSEMHKKNMKITRQNMSEDEILVIRKKIGDGNRGKIVSNEVKQKMSKSHMGKILSIETRKKMSENSYWKNKKKPLIKCPYCSKVGGDVIMMRWHFDNCKNRKE